MPRQRMVDGDHDDALGGEGRFSQCSDEGLRLQIRKVMHDCSRDEGKARREFFQTKCNIGKKGLSMLRHEEFQLRRTSGQEGLAFGRQVVQLLRGAQNTLLIGCADTPATVQRTIDGCSGYACEARDIYDRRSVHHIPR